VSPTYAENTSVSVESSRAEIERTLARYGASAFMYGWSQDKAVIQFAASERQVKFVLTLPDKEDPEFTTYVTGRVNRTTYRRTDTEIQKRWEQACRQRWRALNLVIKAKLEAVEAGISEFEDEFLAHIVLPDGSTAGEFLRPQIRDAYATGAMPSMLPQLGSGS